MVGVCLPCLAVKMLIGEGSLLMWGGCVCCSPLGPPVNLWTTGTVGQQFIVILLCKVGVSNVICIIVSVNCHSEQKCLSLPMNVHQQSISNTISMMSWSVRFLLVARLLNALQRSSAHNKPSIS